MQIRTEEMTRDTDNASCMERQIDTNPAPASGRHLALMTQVRIPLCSMYSYERRNHGTPATLWIECGFGLDVPTTDSQQCCHACPIDHTSHRTGAAPVPAESGAAAALAYSRGVAG